MRQIQEFEQARKLLQQGKILAYPTEAVYGLGCDPFNQETVEKLLALKQRPVDKGLIVLIAEWDHLAPLIRCIPQSYLDKVRASWPGPVTWVFPKSPHVPSWVSGAQDTIAIRMSAHPIAHELSRNGPIISTSANVSEQAPARTLDELHAQFPQGIDALLLGELGDQKRPSAIYDVCSSKCLRSNT